MERQAKDGTFYRQVGKDEWTPVTRTAKDGTVYKKVGADLWSSTEPSQPQNEEKSQAMSGVRQFVQGATGNFSDEAAGAFEAAGRAVGLKGVGGPMKDIGTAEGGPTLDWEILKDAYKRARDKEREALKQDTKDFPKTSVAANVAGAIASPINKILPSASLAKSGATIGAIAGAGASEAEDAKGVIVDAATGAVIGGVAGKVAEKAAPYIEKGARGAREKVGQRAKAAAEWLSARSMGAERGTIKSLGAEKVKAIGRYGLDEGLVTRGASTDSMIAKNAAKQEAGAQKMNRVYEAVDEKGLSTFNPLSSAVEVEKKIGNFYRSPINRGETNQLENTLESILMRGEKDIPLKEAQKLKEELGKVANWKSKVSITDKERMAREAYGVVSEQIDQAVDKGAKKIGSNDLLQTLKDGRRLYSQSKGAEQLLENKLAREQGNNLLGLTDTITAGGALGYGATSGDYEGALAIVAGKRLLGKYGAQNAALAFDKVSKALLAKPKYADMAKKNPDAFNAIVSKITTNITPEGVVKKVASRSELDRDSSTSAIENVGRREPDSEPKKGPEKWAREGFEKLSQHGVRGFDRQQLMNDQKMRELLIQASDLKPGSKAMEKISKKLKASADKGGD